MTLLSSFYSFLILPMFSFVFRLEGEESRGHEGLMVKIQRQATNSPPPHPPLPLLFLPSLLNFPSLLFFGRSRITPPAPPFLPSCLP